MFISIPGNYLAYLTLILVFILENAFGRLTSVYRIFRKPIEQNVANIDRIVLACCSLHNFILHHRGLSWNVQGDAGGKDFDLRNGNQVFVIRRRQGGHVVQETLRNNRNALKDWFVGVGAVPWQVERALRAREGGHDHED